MHYTKLFGIPGTKHQCNKRTHLHALSKGLNKGSQQQQQLTNPTKSVMSTAHAPSQTRADLNEQSQCNALNQNNNGTIVGLISRVLCCAGGVVYSPAFARDDFAIFCLFDFSHSDTKKNNQKRRSNHVACQQFSSNI